MELGDRIKLRRKELGLTLEDVGKAVGVSKSTVRKWETGYIANMRRDKIANLAAALQTTPAHLMGWEGELMTYLSEESKSGRMTAKEEMFRTFGADHYASDLRVCDDKVALLYYKAMDRYRTAELQSIISAVENLSLQEIETAGAILRAYLHADAPIKEIVDTALKPYKQELSLDEEIG